MAQIEDFKRIAQIGNERRSPARQKELADRSHRCSLPKVPDLSLSPEDANGSRSSHGRCTKSTGARS